MTIFLFLVAALLLAWLSWKSIQRLLRLDSLLRPNRWGDEKSSRGRRAALHGRVLCHEPVTLPLVGEVLWHQRLIQKERVVHKYGTTEWITVDTEERTAKCSLIIGGREILVSGPPTKVHDYEERVSTLINEDDLSDDKRAVDRWLRIPETLTVVGQIERGRGNLRILRDGMLGLLFSPRRPRSVVLKESAMGVLGLALVSVGVAAGLWGYREIQTWGPLAGHENAVWSAASRLRETPPSLIVERAGILEETAHYGGIAIPRWFEEMEDSPEIRRDVLRFLPALRPYGREEAPDMHSVLAWFEDADGAEARLYLDSLRTWIDFPESLDDSLAEIGESMEGGFSYLKGSGTWRDGFEAMKDFLRPGKHWWSAGKRKYVSQEPGAGDDPRGEALRQEGVELPPASGPCRWCD